MPSLETFLAGAVTMGFLVAGAFFFRFWLRTRETLFAMFGISFVLLAANQIVVHQAGLPEQELFWAYVLRVLAYLLLIVAIAAKNLEQSRSKLSVPPPLAVDD